MLAARGLHGWSCAGTALIGLCAFACGDDPGTNSAPVAAGGSGAPMVATMGGTPAVVPGKPLDAAVPMRRPTQRSMATTQPSRRCTP